MILSRSKSYPALSTHLKASAVYNAPEAAASDGVKEVVYLIESVEHFSPSACVSAGGIDMDSGNISDRVVS